MGLKGRMEICASGELLDFLVSEVLGVVEWAQFNRGELMKTFVFVLALGISASCLQAQGQFTARGLTSKIRPDSTQNPSSSPSTPAPSAPAPVPVPAAPRVVVSPLVVALDTNHNGVIEAAEIANAPAVLKTLDKNNDGRLTADEYLGVGESAMSPLVKILDFNGDGVIDEKEISKASLSLRMLDKNGDGKLNPSEFKPVAAPVAKAVTGVK